MQICHTLTFLERTICCNLSSAGWLSKLSFAWCYDGCMGWNTDTFHMQFVAHKKHSEQAGRLHRMNKKKHIRSNGWLMMHGDYQMGPVVFCGPIICNYRVHMSSCVSGTLQHVTTITQNVWPEFWKHTFYYRFLVASFSRCKILMHWSLLSPLQCWKPPVNWDMVSSGRDFDKRMSLAYFPLVQQKIGSNGITMFDFSCYSLLGILWETWNLLVAQRFLLPHDCTWGLSKRYMFLAKGTKTKDCKVRRVKFIVLAEVRSSSKANIAFEKILRRTLSLG